MTTSLVTSWEEIIKHELRSRWASKPYYLTRNPYELAELPALEALEASLDVLPRGALRRWGGLVRADSERADELWRRMRAIACQRQPKALAGLDRCLDALKVDPQSGFDDQGRSPLLDAMQWHYARRRSGRVEMER